MISGNFHIHTNFSYDGYNSIRAVYKYAVKAKLSVIAITDHDTIDGAIRFQQFLQKNGKKDLAVITGEEVTCTDGTHIVALFLKEHIPAGTPAEVVKAIKQQNAFVYFPHPARKDGILQSSFRDEAIAYGDFYEAFSSKITDNLNEEARAFFAAFPHILPLAGSDAHYHADIRKVSCNFTPAKKYNNYLDLLLDYKSGQVKLEVMGHPKLSGGNNYFGTYYKYKQQLNLPQWIRNIGKIIAPAYKNFKERNTTYPMKKIL